MTPVVVWIACGIAVAGSTWAAAPGRRGMRLPTYLVLGIGGALFGGLLSWTFWQFPAATQSSRDLLATPVLASYLLAALGALVAVSTAFGVVMRER